MSLQYEVAVHRSNTWNEVLQVTVSEPVWKRLPALSWQNLHQRRRAEHHFYLFNSYLFPFCGKPNVKKIVTCPPLPSPMKMPEHAEHPKEVFPTCARESCWLADRYLGAKASIYRKRCQCCSRGILIVGAKAIFMTDISFYIIFFDMLNMCCLQAWMLPKGPFILGKSKKSTCIIVSKHTPAYPTPRQIIFAKVMTSCWPPWECSASRYPLERSGGCPQREREEGTGNCRVLNVESKYFVRQTTDSYNGISSFHDISSFFPIMWSFVSDALA